MKCDDCLIDERMRLYGCPFVKVGHVYPNPCTFAPILKALPGASEEQIEAAARILNGSIHPDFVNNYFKYGTGSSPAAHPAPTEPPKGRR
jgi:hypothetical protein